MGIWVSGEKVGPTASKAGPQLVHSENGGAAGLRLRAPLPGPLSQHRALRDGHDDTPQVTLSAGEGAFGGA